MKSLSTVLLLSLLLCGASSFAFEPLSFNRDVRAILSDTCFQCHGPDDRKRQGGLRLDIREKAIVAAESGKIPIVAGDLEQSEILNRLVSTDPSTMMPPPDSGKRLTMEQIEILRRWVAEGANYEPHWAFVPVARPKVPEITSPYIRNAVDRFVLSRLNRDGLTFSPEADRETLLRRVSLDLTGLPPTRNELQEFLSDSSPDAYEKVVDRLLMSPRYGERMALPWLDYARYADSNGYQIDSSRYQWPWRDWVINAFNSNKPFDQFTIEQNAGDMLPNASKDQIVATGFHRNHRLNGEGGIIAEEWRVETVIDRVETAGLTWLGLTLNCCRCHDHKYDPITQREFYQLFSYFNNLPESGTLQGESRNTDPVVSVPSPEQTAKLAEIDQLIATTEAQRVEAESKLRPELVAWLPGFRQKLADLKPMWHDLHGSEAVSAGGATLTRQPDGSFLASGTNPSRDVYEWSAPINQTKFSGILLECFIDPSLPQQSLGRYDNGNFVLSGVDIEIDSPGQAAPKVLQVERVAADFSQAGWVIEEVLARNPGKGWAVDGPTRKENRRAMFLIASPVDVPEQSKIRVRLRQEALDRHNIGKFRISVTDVDSAVASLSGDGIPASIRENALLDDSVRTEEKWKELESYFRTLSESTVSKKEREVAQLQKERKDLESKIPTVMVMAEGARRAAFVLNRGQYDQPGAEVEAGLPVALPGFEGGAAKSRLDFARWLVQRNNPLTSRVWVNRIWEKFFGTGIVKTSENFGSQAEYPSHPELLDWLAAEFMEPTELPAVAGVPAHAWDMKAIQKLIVMSGTYRQSSKVKSDVWMIDPENRLFARGPRFRLPAEVLRDQSLFVSGMLVEKVGGPSVRPYMPKGVWDETSRYGDLLNYREDSGEGLYRRSLYTIWKRTAAPPSMLIFDAPNREICTVKRSRTNTPLQALVMLNENTYVEAARKLAERMITEGGAGVEARLQLGFESALGRKPSAEEVVVLKNGIEQDLAHFKANVAAANELLAVGNTPSPDTIDRAELAAYTLAANVLLNLDEFIMRE